MSTSFRHDARQPGEIEASFSREWHHHGRERAGTEQRCRGDGVGGPTVVRATPPECRGPTRLVWHSRSRAGDVWTWTGSSVRQALDRAGWKLSDIDRIEINEAFAAIAIAVVRELGLPEDIVNVEGGAIAHGHPIGATGAILTTRLIHSMRRDGLKRGVVTLCIGGGQGIALTLETIA